MSDRTPLPPGFGSLEEVRAAVEGYREVVLDDNALTAAHVAVEDVLVEFRDSRLSVMGPANGFVVKEKDGKDSPIMRLGTREGISIAIRAYLKASEVPNAEAR